MKITRLMLILTILLCGCAPDEGFGADRKNWAEVFSMGEIESGESVQQSAVNFFNAWQYTFQIEKGQYFAVTIQGLDDKADPRLFIYDETMKRIGYDDDWRGVTLSAAFTRVALSTGTYTIVFDVWNADEHDYLISLWIDDQPLSTYIPY